MTASDTEEDLPGLPRNYLRSCLLLLLAEGTSHGYELLEQMSRLGAGRVDPGGLYRSLRAMDEDGLVHSTWEPSSTGPARRTYELTTAGRNRLDTAARAVTEVGRSLDTYLRRYRAVARERTPAP